MFDSGSKFSGKALKKTKPRVESKKQIDVKATGKSSKKEKPKDKEIPEQVVMSNKRKGKQIVTENQPPKKKQQRQGDCKEKDSNKLKDLHDSPFFHKRGLAQTRGECRLAVVHIYVCSQTRCRPWYTMRALKQTCFDTLCTRSKKLVAKLTKILIRKRHTTQYCTSMHLLGFMSTDHNFFRAKTRILLINQS
ncbi:hypothetical protein MKW98_023944 [Papaver atlanticum]|uniref:Uncharacterized protein n=1 Tax=Papaver atlanticum TaxID=357466 RepID=A0AAD4XN66_9MAGN|nr:hypothetical protein MKW98_023944 [Papaver atlanticum]